MHTVATCCECWPGEEDTMLLRCAPCCVNHGPVQHRRVAADPNLVQVATQHGTVKDGNLERAATCTCAEWCVGAPEPRCSAAICACAPGHRCLHRRPLLRWVQSRCLAVSRASCRAAKCATAAGCTYKRQEMHMRSLRMSNQLSHAYAHS